MFGRDVARIAAWFHVYPVLQGAGAGLGSGGVEVFCDSCVFDAMELMEFSERYFVVGFVDDRVSCDGGECSDRDEDGENGEQFDETESAAALGWSGHRGHEGELCVAVRFGAMRFAPGSDA